MSDTVIKVSGRVLPISGGTAKLNPHLFPVEQGGQKCGKICPPSRIRQERKPVLNKLESDWLDKLRQDYPDQTFRFQDRRYKLANGVWYKPDITCQRHRCYDTDHVAVETCWECKGPKQMKGIARGVLMVKMAAAHWPEILWFLVWRDPDTKEWNEERVLP